MKRHAVASRVLWFSAGPQSHRFYACEEHRVSLERGNHDGLFFAREVWPIEPVDADDEIDCDICRGEDGP